MPWEVTEQEVRGSSGFALSMQNAWQQLKLRPRVLRDYSQGQNDLTNISRTNIHVLTFFDFPF